VYIIHQVIKSYFDKYKDLPFPLTKGIMGSTVENLLMWGDPEVAALKERITQFENA